MPKNVVEILIRARDEASKELRKSGTELERLHKQAAIAGAAISAIGTGAVVGLTAAALAGAKYADTIADISDRTGLAADTVATLGVALERSGGTVHDTEMAVRSLSGAMTEAVAGNETAIRAFERLGIPVASLTRDGGLVTIDELLPRLADGMARLGEGAARSDAAVTLLGRSGLALVPVLKDGAAGFAKSTDEARKMGLALGDDATRRAGMLDDAMVALRQSITGLNTSIAAGLGPTLSGVAGRLSVVTQALARFAREHQSVTVAGTAFAAIFGISGAIPVGLYALAKLQAGIAANFGSFAALLRGPAVAAVLRMAGTIGVLVASLTILYELYKKVIDPQKDLRTAQENYNATLRDEKATVDDLVAAYARLEAERNKRKPQIGDAGDVSMFGDFRGAPGGVRPTVSEFVVDEAFMQLQRDVRAKRIQISIATENAEKDIRDKLDALEIQINGDTRPLERQIAEARASLGSLREDAERKAVKVSIAESGGADPGKIAELRADASDAAQKYSATLIKINDLEEKKAQRDRELAQTSRELADGLLDLDAAAGRIKIDEVLKRQNAAASEALATLEGARARYESATVGTEEYERATEALKVSLENYNSTAARAAATDQVIREARAQDAQNARSLADAYRALSEAQARLQVTQTAPDTQSAEASLRALELQSASQRLASAKSAVIGISALGIDPTLRIDELNELTAATDAYNNALAAVNQTQEQTSASAEAAQSVVGSFGSAFSGVFSAMIAGAGSAVNTIRSIIASLISTIVSAIAKMLFLKAVAGALTGGTSLILPTDQFQGLVGAFTGTQSGGEIMAGSRGIDSVPLMTGRGENVLDHRTNDRLKRMLGAFESGSLGNNGGSVAVTVSAPMLSGGRAEAQRIARAVSDEIERADLFGVSQPSFAG